jgi:hypothetical protein
MANDRERNQNEEAITGKSDEEMTGRVEEGSDDEFENVDEVDEAAEGAEGDEEEVDEE